MTGRGEVPTPQQPCWPFGGRQVRATAKSESPTCCIFSSSTFVLIPSDHARKRGCLMQARFAIVGGFLWVRIRIKPPGYSDMKVSPGEDRGLCHRRTGSERLGELDTS
jgi:hypothetical protein